MNTSTQTSNLPEKIEIVVTRNDNGDVRITTEQENLDFLFPFFNKQIPSLSNLNVIFNDNATILVNKKTKEKSVVKKYAYDDEDREKAVLYALLKLMNITSVQIKQLLDRAVDYNNNKTGQKG